MALLMVVIGVMVYLAFRFEWKFAVAAIIANLHDVVIILGFFAFFQWEFSLSVLAAVLAVLGYSVNESVVIFDRIRENFRKLRKASVTEVIDSAITSTICAGADHRHPVRHLFISVRGRSHCNVAWRQARRPDQTDQTEGRDRRRGGVTQPKQRKAGFQAGFFVMGGQSACGPKLVESMAYVVFVGTHKTN
jgi:hypothetical protein